MLRYTLALILILVLIFEQIFIFALFCHCCYFAMWPTATASFSWCLTSRLF